MGKTALTVDYISEGLLAYQDMPWSRRLTQRLVAAGDLPTVRIGGRVFFIRADVNALIARSRTDRLPGKGRGIRCKQVIKRQSK